MIEQPATVEEYCCPGESHPISRALHLGRLARFYPPCRRCRHRSDTGSLSARQLQRFRQSERCAPPCPAVGSEATTGVIWNQVTPALVHSLATAFGLWLRERCPADAPPSVLVAADGRAIATEFVAAVGEGLRWTGCHCVDTGSATAPTTAAAVSQLNCDGGILVGNPTGRTATAGIRLWGSGGVPLSSPGSLDAVRDLQANRPSRPARRYGSAKRLSVAGMYLESLREHYHALRPLRFAIRCTTPAMLWLVDDLIGRTACQSIVCTGHALGRTVIDAGAHFGVNLEEDGERCRVVDEQRRDVEPLRIAALVAHELAADLPCRILDTASREETYQHLRVSPMAMAADHEGRFWYRRGENHWAPDGLITLSLLLRHLSRSDRPLSELLV